MALHLCLKSECMMGDFACTPITQRLISIERTEICSVLHDVYCSCYSQNSDDLFHSVSSPCSVCKPSDICFLSQRLCSVCCQVFLQTYSALRGVTMCHNFTPSGNWREFGFCLQSGLSVILIIFRQNIICALKIFFLCSRCHLAQSQQSYSYTK